VKRATFFDGQDILTNDLEFMETERVAELEQRLSTTEIAATPGILTGLTLSSPAAFTIRIAFGVAYDDLGKDMRLPSPSTFDLSFAGGDTGKLITIGHVDTEPRTTRASSVRRPFSCAPRRRPARSSSAPSTPSTDRTSPHST
jgi:hypothetical protein